ncbi:MAG: PIG-L family deacetylase [Desulfobacteraceae bacterium]|nr:PIG-L family deacetylase [Desulfobacteraceae bacterium]
MKVLVISAHPDDEVIGAGGTIARHVDHGDVVYWCVVTQAYNPPWSKEYLETARQQVYDVKKVLGIQKVFFCGFPTVKLNTVPYMEISSALQEIVGQVQPEIVYTTPGNDINLDHRIVYECTLVATRPLPGNSIQRLLSYEIGPGSRQGLTSGESGFVSNVFVDISQYIDKKLEAMSCYGSELQEYPHPRSLKGLRMVAEERGLGVGLKAAEAFRLVREVL